MESQINSQDIKSLYLVEFWKNMERKIETPFSICFKVKNVTNGPFLFFKFIEKVQQFFK